MKVRALIEAKDADEAREKFRKGEWHEIGRGACAEMVNWEMRGDPIPND